MLSCNIKEMSSKAKYLDIPSFWGKSKSEALNSIIEKVRGVLQGWNQNLLSSAGKEVLIKSVVQVIPAYFMSCVSFSLKVCKSIDKLIHQFWWEGYGKRELCVRRDDCDCVVKTKKVGSIFEI